LYLVNFSPSFFVKGLVEEEGGMDEWFLFSRKGRGVFKE
jgi:hypothetical protein